MATGGRISTFRHEGHVFFIYDHSKKTEEDDPKDAVLYFHPSFVEIDDQIALIGGIVGLSDFCLEYLPQSMPSMVKLSGRKFALLQHGSFIIGLGGSNDIPDMFLMTHMQFVWSTFVLYHGGLSALKQRVKGDSFTQELKNVWDYYLPLRQIQEDALTQAFQVLPYVHLHKSQGNLFLHASHILQRSLTYKGVIAGALFNKNKVLCTQLSNSLTRQLLLLMSHSQFPCVESSSVLELPGGVRLLHVYLPKDEYIRLGFRRKKTYKFGKSQGKTVKKVSTEQNQEEDLLISTPVYNSVQNVFSEVGSGPDMLHGSKLSIGNVEEVSSGSRYLSVRETNTSKVSPTGGLGSGTDSEIFLDSLSDMNFDTQNQLKLADIKQVECATNAWHVSQVATHQEAPILEPSATQFQNSLPAPMDIPEHNVVIFGDKSNGEAEKSISDLCWPEKIFDGGRLSCTDNPEHYLHKSASDISEQKNIAHETTSDEIKKALYFSENKNSNANKSTAKLIYLPAELANHSLLSDTAVVENFDKLDTTMVEHSDMLDTNKVEHSYKLDSKVISDLIFGTADMEGTCSTLNENNGGSVESSVTSTNSSGNNLSLEQPLGEEHPHLKSDFITRENSQRIQDGEESVETRENSHRIQDGEESIETKIDLLSRLHQTEEMTSHLKKKVIVAENKNDRDITKGFSSKLSSSHSRLEHVDKTDNKCGFQSSSACETVNNDLMVQGSPSASSNLCSDGSFNITEILAQNQHQIDASLEAPLSGEESSAPSSSEVKHADHEVSTLSLAYSEASATRDRLIFEEAVDSEFSEAGQVSPESHRLSPVTESSGHLLDDVFTSRSESDGGTNSTFGVGNQSPQTPGQSRSRSTSSEPACSRAFSQWDPQDDNLQEVILYAQGHSDTLLLLLVSHMVKFSKTYISSLWKSCLSHLAELDFQVKDAERHSRDDTETLGTQHQYIKYDSFTHSLKGSALFPVTSLANEIVDSSVRMHENFISMPELQEITYRSHSACCYGHRTENLETYFQLGLSRTSAGICPPNDKTFCLDQMAEKFLPNDK